MDLPLLFEAGVMVPYMHKIIVVTCEEDLQLQRLMEQRHLSERDAKLMIGSDEWVKVLKIFLTTVCIQIMYKQCLIHPPK